MSREGTMTITTILKSSTAVSMVALLALSACGGGGGDGPDTGGMPPDNGDMMPGDGDGDGDGDGTATEFGDDRLTASLEASPEATSTADTLYNLAGTDIALAPVSAPIGLEFDANGNVGTMPLEDDKSAYVESATVQDAQGNITVVYVVDGQRTEVQFQGSDWNGFEYAKDVDGTNYYAWFALTFTGVPRVDVIPQYTGLFGWQAGRDARGYSVDGLVTPPHRLTGL